MPLIEIMEDLINIFLWILIKFTQRIICNRERWELDMKSKNIT